MAQHYKLGSFLIMRIINIYWNNLFCSKGIGNQLNRNKAYKESYSINYCLVVIRPRITLFLN